MKRFSASQPTPWRERRKCPERPCDPWRQAAPRAASRSRGEEPRHQGDGRGAPRRDASACCATCPTSATSTSSAACSRCTASTVADGDEPGDAAASTRQRAQRRTFDEIDAHAGSSRIPILFCGPLLHRLGEALIPDLGGCRIGDRPIDFHLDALRAVRRHRRQAAERHPACPRPNGLHGAQHRPAVPERRRDRAGAAHRRAGQGRHRAAERGDRARDHGSHRDPAEDGRDHLGRAEPRHPHRGRRRRCAGYTHRRIFDRNEAASWASRRARHRTATSSSAARSSSEMLTFLNVFRKVGGAFDVRRATASASGTRAAR